MENVSIPLSRIRIHTRQMSNVTWFDIWGRRTRLKCEIAQAVRSNPELKRLFIEHGRIDITEVTIGRHPQNVGQPYIGGPYGYTQDIANVEAIVAFGYRGEFYRIEPVVLYERPDQVPAEPKANRP